ncbi:nucleoside-diphosphate kinase [Paenibacillus tuaregi]|uniref:nucleoside-diphosphate kinase n=1 Tax=Paenibacillus tuaregi TaxID=1816681 RepID=UPI0008382CA8|nr:nucleoside-diphosphate kinase [Paenibacillus tuaregi]
MAVSRTFVMVKPDGTRRGLIGDIMRRFEHRGFRLVDAKQMNVDSALAEQHYVHLKAKPFFQELVDYITSGPVFAMVWEAENAVQLSRNMIGPTNPAEAGPGTIRGDYGTSVEANVIHGSDSDESAEREIALFFGTR